MNKHLANLISEYQASVRVATSLMHESGIPLPASRNDWVATNIPRRGELNGAIPYFKHGYGCKVGLPTGAVDFDFGLNGEIDGFDAWRLAGFASSRLSEYGFSSEGALNEYFKAEAAAGSLVYSGYLLYYIADAA